MRHKSFSVHRKQLRPTCIHYLSDHSSSLYWNANRTTYRDQSCTCSKSSAHCEAESVLDCRSQRRKYSVCQSCWRLSLSRENKDGLTWASRALTGSWRTDLLLFNTWHSWPIRLLYPLRREFLISCSSLMDFHCTFILKYSSLQKHRGLFWLLLL